MQKTLAELARADWLAKCKEDKNKKPAPVKTIDDFLSDFFRLDL